MKTLKTSGLLLLLLVMLVQCNMSLIVFTRFEMNRDYIVANLCENRSKPSMHCNGHCYLEKEMQRQEKNAPDPLTNLYQKMILLWVPEETTSSFGNQGITVEFPACFSPGICAGFDHGLFRPPGSGNCIKA